MVTGKSEKQQVIAFIDYENCSNLTEIALNIYTAYFHERRSLNNFHRDRVITFEQIAE